MNALVDLLNNPWVQMICWVAAAAMVLRLMKGAGMCWNLLAAGILLYGFRVVFKLMPFYDKAIAWPQIMRYMIGIIGGLVLLIAIIDYYHSKLKPIMEMV